jgi:hypothetical protein
MGSWAPFTVQPSRADPKHFSQNVQNVRRKGFTVMASATQPRATFNAGYAETVDIVLLWKRAGGNGKNHYKKLQSSH